MSSNKKLRFVFLLLIIFIVFFNLRVYSYELEDDWIYSSLNANIELYLKSGVDLKYGSNGKIEYLEIEDRFFPRNNNNLDYIQVKYFPKEPKISDDSLTFVFFNPEFERLEFGLLANLSVRNNFVKVKNKIEFPLAPAKIPAELWKYTNPTEHIDSDSKEIKDLAQKLVSGKTDFYDVAFTLAKWVKNNINYSLDSTTEDVTEKASWVLLNKRGVCDELTSLYIALLRAVGIPARYVSGIAYTNSKLFSRNWGFHGWAQVYFPGYGWLDFDPTYGQYGFVDLSHIPLSYSLDSGESSTKYSIKSYDVNLESWPMDYNVKVKEINGKADKENIDVKVSLNSDRYGLNSYGLLVAQVKNNNDFYFPLTLRLSKVSNLEFLEDSGRDILLKPRETKSVVWIFHIFGLNSGDYLFPIEIYTLRNRSFNAKFKVSSRYKDYSLDNIKSLVPNKNVDDTIDVKCSADKSVYYSYESLDFNCSTLLSGAKLCVSERCVDFNISGDSYKAKMKIDNLAPFVDTGLIKADVVKNNKIIKSLYLPVSILPAPQVKIINLSYPDLVEYGSDFELFFKLNPKYFNGKVNLTLSFGMFNKTWNLDLNSIKPFKIQIDSSNFLSDNTRFDLSLTYFDVNGNKYSEAKSFSIGLKEFSFFDRLMMFINKIEFFVEKKIILLFNKMQEDKNKI